MLSKNVAKSTYRKAVLIVSLLGLAGCLPSEEVDTPDSLSTGDGGSTLTDHRVSGSVGDGPIIDAQINITARNGLSLVTTSSDASANYDITVETGISDYPLSILAFGGTDLVTMTSPDFDVMSVVKSSAGISVANLNPFTTVAVELATDLPGGITAENIDAALSIVFSELNSGLSSLSGSAAMESTITGSNIAQLMRSSEALGELVRRTRDALSAVGRNVSGNDIVAALGSDLIDSVLDGRGGPRADARIAAVAGLVRAQVALETMQNELRVQGTDATTRIQSAMDQVFVGVVSPSLTELRATSQLVDVLQTGLLAANNLQPSAEFDTLLADVSTLTGGMSASQVRQQISSDARAAFDTSIVAVAGASASDIDSVNEILRRGGEPGQNSAPVIAGTPDTRALVGVQYNFQPEASDADGDELTFSISGMPAWASFNVSSGAISGIPQAEDVGENRSIVISVSDGDTTASLPAFTISIVNSSANTPPTISGNPATQVAVGENYDFRPHPYDADGDALTFSISSKPAWAFFDTATGRLSGVVQESDIGIYSNIIISVYDGDATSSLPPFSVSVVDILVNTPPTISGSPAAQVLVGAFYNFQPSAGDADGDTITFSVSGLPSWASFDQSSGQVSGTPTPGDVGVFSAINISVSDGQDSASLEPFSITVEAVTLGSATLSWTPPTQNTDGTPLTDLTGYRIYWGSTSGNYTESVTLDNPGLSTYVVENLMPGNWYFVSTAVNGAGVESSYSNVAAKTVP